MSLNWDRAKPFRPHVGRNPVEQRAEAFLGKRRKPRRYDKVSDFGHHLRGLGGLQTERVRALRGSTFGPASSCRRLGEEERRAIEARLRTEGRLNPAVPR